MISCGCSPRKSREARAPAVLEGIAFAPRYIIGRTRITMVAQVLLAASLSFLTTPPPALLSLAAFSQRAASVVRSTTRQHTNCVLKVGGKGVHIAMRCATNGG